MSSCLNMMHNWFDLFLILLCGGKGSSVCNRHDSALFLCAWKPRRIWASQLALATPSTPRRRHSPKRVDGRRETWLWLVALSWPSEDCTAEPIFNFFPTSNEHIQAAAAAVGFRGLLQLVFLAQFFARFDRHCMGKCFLNSLRATQTIFFDGLGFKSKNKVPGSKRQHTS